MDGNGGKSSPRFRSSEPNAKPSRQKIRAGWRCDQLQVTARKNFARGVWQFSFRDRVCRATIPILTKRNSVATSRGQKLKNVRTTLEKTARIRDFQAEYEGSIPFTRSNVFQ
jgi:hypothetical protein